ncbi:MAG: hemolysin III family protein [Candidatus Hydrogenedentes bacterium]|nr:hemolysin III family protein [Candidatus Hydrogenedentota bacterium]
MSLDRVLGSGLSVIWRERFVSDAAEKAYSTGEELANVITHGIGALLSIAGGVLLIVLAALGADAWRIVGVTVFGITLVLLYLASMFYHALPYPDAKRIMRICDHCAIYLLIAGTYTPFLLGDMRGPWGWLLFGLLWGGAAIGCTIKLFFTGRFNKISTACYVAMGWAIVLALKPAIESVPVGAMVLMLAGGLSYTGGVVFYLWDRLPYNHAIWHCFVLGGSTMHYLAILFFVAMAAPGTA